MDQIDRSLFKHSDTGQIYGIARRWNGTLIGSCSPLPETDLKSTTDYDYTPNLNTWIKEEGNKLILV